MLRNAAAFAALAAFAVVQGCSGNGSHGGAAADAAAAMDVSTVVPPEAPGCGATMLLTVPDDPSLPGPWPVGVQTVSIPVNGGGPPDGGVGVTGTAGGASGSGFNLTAEIWYPATIGSEAGKPQKPYDLRTWLPPSQQSKIPDSAVQNNFQSGCYSGLPIDATHGPYPAVIFIHGTGSIRIASITEAVQWASRGFIVVASDHPGLDMEDSLATAGALGALAYGPCPGSGISEDVSRDVDAEIAALTPPSGDLTFLGTSIDMTRIGISGHSAGAGDAAMYSTKPNVEVDIPLATMNGVSPSSTLKSVLIMAGEQDKVIAFSDDESSYASSPTPKRLIGIPNTGHLVPTDLCYLTNAQGQNISQVGIQYHVCGVQLVSDLLFDCSSSYIDEATGNAIMNYATTAALEETLHCVDESAAWANLVSHFASPDAGVIGDGGVTPVTLEFEQDLEAGAALDDGGEAGATTGGAMDGGAEAAADGGG
jgi:hypothetical protein